MWRGINVLENMLGEVVMYQIWHEKVMLCNLLVTHITNLSTTMTIMVQ